MMDGQFGDGSFMGIIMAIIMFIVMIGSGLFGWLNPGA